jgi:hypothetical protein
MYFRVLYPFYYNFVSLKWNFQTIDANHNDLLQGSITFLSALSTLIATLRTVTSPIPSFQACEWGHWGVQVNLRRGTRYNHYLEKLTKDDQLLGRPSKDLYPEYLSAAWRLKFWMIAAIETKMKDKAYITCKIHCHFTVI